MLLLLFLSVFIGACQPYDLTGSGSVGLADFSVFIKQFGKTQLPNTGANFNDDNIVNLQDFSLFIKAFGKSRATGLRNPVAVPAGTAMNDLAAVLSAPSDSPINAISTLSLETDVLDAVLEPVFVSAVYDTTLWSAPMATSRSIAALEHIGLAGRRTATSHYPIETPQSEEFYRRRFFEELAMESETESTEVSDEWLTLEAVLCQQHA